MLKLLLIAAGGAVGSVLRYLIAGWVQLLAGGAFPLGTLAVNVTGCLLIGFLHAAFTTGPVLVREEYKLALTVGVLGGFTTFSTFSLETVTLAGDRELFAALLNAVASLILGCLAAWAGFRIAYNWFGV